MASTSYPVVILILGLSFPITAEGIRKAVGDRGASRVLLELSKDHDKLAEVERNIASGASEWLSVGLDLYGGCDAGMCYAIELAFSSALVKHPTRVLHALATPQMVREVCSNYEPSGPGLEGCLVEIGKMRRSVEGVSDPSVKDLKDLCLSHLAELERLAQKACS